MAGRAQPSGPAGSGGGAPGLLPLLLLLLSAAAIIPRGREDAAPAHGAPRGRAVPGRAARGAGLALGDRGGARAAPVAAGAGRARPPSSGSAVPGALGGPGEAPPAAGAAGGLIRAWRRGQPLPVSMEAASPLPRGVISGPAIKN